MPIFFHRPDGLRQRDLCQRSPRVRGQPEVPADPPAAVTYREQPAASGLLDQGLQAQPAGESWKDLAYNHKSFPILRLGFSHLKTVRLFPFMSYIFKFTPTIKGPQGTLRVPF